MRRRSVRTTLARSCYIDFSDFASFNRLFRCWRSTRLLGWSVTRAQGPSERFFNTSWDHRLATIDADSASRDKANDLSNQ
jgi:hypothetical protein